MSTGYYTKRGGTVEWALGGDSPGTPANWLTLSSQSLADAMASVHGSFVMLTPASFDSFRDRYLSPLSVSGGGGSVDDSRVLTAVAGVSTQIKNFPAPPTAAENGAAARDAIVKS